MDETLLKQYAAAARALVDLRAANTQVFDAEAGLTEILTQTEKLIKDEAHKSGVGAEFEGVVVKVTPRYKKSYVFDKFSADDQAILKAGGAVKIEVVREAVDTLVEEEKISQRAISEAFIEEALTPSVSVKYVERGTEE